MARLTLASSDIDPSASIIRNSIDLFDALSCDSGSGDRRQAAGEIAKEASAELKTILRESINTFVFSFRRSPM
jgi:hypothetical protein